MKNKENKTCFIGVDLGTSGCRAVAIDRERQVLATAQRSLPTPQRSVDGGSEQDPELWWQALRSALQELSRQAPPVAAVAIDGTSATVLLCNGSGSPLAPALMYDDSRARDEADRIAAMAPPQSTARGASSSLSKLLWLRARHPDARHALHQADWLAGRLWGRYDHCDENNALKLGYDPVARDWPDWLQGLGIARSWLPTAVAPGTALGPVTPRLAAELGLRPETRVVAGTTDSTAAFLATGAHAVGEAVTSLGSTMVLKVLASRPVFAPEFGVYSHRLGERWLAGGASNSGGAVLLEHFDHSQLQALTPMLDPGRPTGLDYYPLRCPGERFPIADPELPPRLTPRPAEPERFFQAMLEGMAAIEAKGYQLLARLGAPYPSSVRTVGGGACNPAWSALRAARLGVPMREPDHRDACYGAALLARAGALGVPLRGNITHGHGRARRPD